jgi:16S rRNA (cytosine967-C5)-methyltransferase
VISPARSVAFNVLLRVEAGGYASDLLLAESATLQSRDAGLASEIVFGSLRYQAQLDHLIGLYSGRPAARLDAEVRIALRMAIYQLRYLERIPPHAAVSEAVELIKRAKKRSAAGFANAVLRKVNRDPVQWPDKAIELSQPKWLLDRWEKQFGAAEAERIAQAFLLAPETYVRNAPDRPGLILEPTDVPGASKVVSGDTAGLRIQDVGSQSIVPFLGLSSGHRFLDVCSAPGNKTAQALETAVDAVASDVHLHRLRNVAADKRVLLDATGPMPFGRVFDRILVDAPCTGTGTLARNPEIRWRLNPSDIQELQQKQIAILHNALAVLAPGGRLVYSTCSLEREENEDVVAPLGSRVLEVHRRTPGSQAGDGFFAAVITSD